MKLDRLDKVFIFGNDEPLLIKFMIELKIILKLKLLTLLKLWNQNFNYFII
jgi:hypothetical protein